MKMIALQCQTYRDDFYYVLSLCRFTVKLGWLLGGIAPTSMMTPWYSSALLALCEGNPPHKWQVMRRVVVSLDVIVINVLSKQSICQWFKGRRRIRLTKDKRAFPCNDVWGRSKLRGVITYPCLRYLLLATKSSYAVRHQLITAVLRQPCILSTVIHTYKISAVDWPCSINATPLNHLRPAYYSIIVGFE